MQRIASAFLLGLLLINLGCDGSSSAITDPSKLKPVSEEEKAAVRKADAAINEEENANPTKPAKAGKAK